MRTYARILTCACIWPAVQLPAWSQDLRDAWVAKKDGAFFCSDFIIMEEAERDKSKLPSGCSFIKHGEKIFVLTDFDAPNGEVQIYMKSDGTKGKVRLANFESYDRPETIKTAAGAFACSRPSMAEEGQKAAQANDNKWLKQAGCFFLQPDITAIRIQDYPTDNLWQVRLDPNGPSATTAWAYSSSFVAQNGDRLTASGRRLR